MKIRTGFVSNSSSTSFCIYGVHRMDYSEEIEEAAGKLGLFARSGPDGDGIFFGREWSSIGDDETGKQFKLKTEQLVQQIPSPDGEKWVLSTYEEGWFDG